LLWPSLLLWLLGALLLLLLLWPGLLLRLLGVLLLLFRLSLLLWLLGALLLSWLSLLFMWVLLCVDWSGGSEKQNCRSHSER
jgi:hypothetical protein